MVETGYISLFHNSIYNQLKVPTFCKLELIDENYVRKNNSIPKYFILYANKFTVEDYKATIEVSHQNVDLIWFLQELVCPPSPKCKLSLDINYRAKIVHTVDLGYVKENSHSISVNELGIKNKPPKIEKSISTFIFQAYNI